MKNLKLMHLVASNLNPAPFFNPLSIAYKNPAHTAQTECDSDEMRVFIYEEFRPLFTKFSKMFKVLEKFYIEHEAKNGYNSMTQQIGNAINEIETMSISKEKDAKQTLQYALSRIPDNVIEEIFTTICDNPHLILQEDFM